MKHVRMILKPNQLQICGARPQKLAKVQPQMWLFDTADPDEIEFVPMRKSFSSSFHSTQAEGNRSFSQTSQASRTEVSTCSKYFDLMEKLFE